MGWLDWLGKRREVDETRWVVLDVETSGLDPARDRLLAIAAIAVRVDWAAKRLAIVPADSFEVVLRQRSRLRRWTTSSCTGSARSASATACRAGEALRALQACCGNSPLLAFHAAFDRALIERYARPELGAGWSPPWLDIEHLCAVTHESVAARSLDEWMAYFGIHCALRHQAAADTLAECEVLLRVWPRVAAECSSWRDVARLAARQRWIARA